MNKYVIGGIVLIVILAGLWYFWPSENYNNFAKCLTKSGAKFYGTYWCPVCNHQKELFGSSLKYAPYVECSVKGTPHEQMQVCKDEKIESYPTWRFTDGSELTGAIPLDQLASQTGCELPQ